MMLKRIIFLLAISTAAQSNEHDSLLNSSGDIVGQIDRAIQLVGAATEYSSHGTGWSDGTLSSTAHISTDQLEAYNAALTAYADNYQPYGSMQTILQGKAQGHLDTMNASIETFTEVVVEMSSAIQINEKLSEASTPDDRAEVQTFVQDNQEMLVITQEQTEEFNQATDDIESNANAAAVYLAVAESSAAEYLQETIESSNTHADDVTLFYDANAQWVQMGYSTTRNLTIVALTGDNDYGLDLYVSEADVLAVGVETEFYASSPVGLGYDCFFDLECE